MAKVTVAVEEITPAIAMQMLAKNPNNRSVTKNHVTVLAREMTMGDWQVTGQGISISNKGLLLDGQHRLLAVEASGKTINLVVARGIDKKAMNVIDTVAKSRSASDIFSMRGIHNAITVAAGINLLNKFSAGGRFHMLSQTDMRLTQSQFDKYLELFPQIQEWADYSHTLSEHVTYFSIVTGLGVVFGLAEQEEEQARQFFWKLDSGEMLHKHEPIYELRKHLMRFNATRKTFRIRPETIVWLIIKTWNAHVAGVEVKSLAVGGRERMPLVAGFDPTVLPYYTGSSTKEGETGSLL
jgi:hypothetical protein